MGHFACIFFILCFLQFQLVIIKHCILWILISFPHQRLAYLELHYFQKRVQNFVTAHSALIRLKMIIKLFTAKNKQLFFYPTVFLPIITIINQVISYWPNYRPDLRPVTGQIQNNLITVKPVLSGHSKRRPKLVFKTDYGLMKVKSIAECSKGTFDLH